MSQSRPNVVTPGADSWENEGGSVARKVGTPVSRWRKLARRARFPQDQAARQGNITQLAVLTLGRDGAITFLNTIVPALGGGPLAIATASEAGEAEVRAMLNDLAALRTEGEQSERSSTPGSS
jgi:hypothetical protein